jgi:serine/threonine protein kinase
MGLVFRARDRRREEARDRHPFVAIKLLGDDFKTHPDSLIALQREARRMQQLSHPNIAAVYDFDRDGPHVYLVMELLEGESLDKILAQHPNAPLPRQLALSVIAGAGDALRHAHSRGVVHSDFKPANVFVARSGEVKVIDFGIARIAKDSTQGAETTMTVFDAGQLGAWTNAYASPEQILRAADPDPRDDIYAFGLVVYEMLSGKHPFGKKSAVEARFREMKLEPVAGLTLAQNEALAAALHFDRDQRLADMSALIRAFADEDEPIVATRDGAPRAAQPPAAAGGKGRGRWRIAGLAILVLAWIAFFAAYRMTRDDSSPDAAVPTADQAAPGDQPREPPQAGGTSGPPATAAATATAAAPEARRPATPQASPMPSAAGSSAPQPPVAAQPTGESAGGRVAATVTPPVSNSGADAAPKAGGTESEAAAGAAPEAGGTASAGVSESRQASTPAEVSPGPSETGSSGESPAATETPPAAKPSLYRWVDKDGKVQFGEKPPEEYADSAVKVMDL